MEKYIKSYKELIIENKQSPEDVLQNSTKLLDESDILNESARKMVR
jgi:hypothetical protein